MEISRPGFDRLFDLEPQFAYLQYGIMILILTGLTKALNLSYTFMYLWHTRYLYTHMITTKAFSWWQPLWLLMSWFGDHWRSFSCMEFHGLKLSLQQTQSFQHLTEGLQDSGRETWVCDHNSHSFLSVSHCRFHEKWWCIFDILYINKILFLSYKSNYNINHILFGWHHQLDGREFEKALGVGDGQGSLACYNSWGQKESDTTERLNWTELNDY